MDRKGIEPLPPRCKRGVLPLSLTALLRNTSTPKRWRQASSGNHDINNRWPEISSKRRTKDISYYTVRTLLVHVGVEDRYLD